jgi:hypothetical protein
MPAVRHQALGIHSLDGELHRYVLVAGRRELAFDSLAQFEGALELDAKPRPELLGVGKRSPNTRAWRSQDDLSLDAVGGRLMQLHGCIVPVRSG